MSAEEQVFDYVIVGAGSAGCVTAERLSRDGKTTVCVLEAGRDDNAVIVRNPMMLQFVVPADDFGWGYWTEPQKHLNDRSLFWPRGKVLGGSSSINAMHYIRGARENYDEWAGAFGCEGWTFDELLPRFKRQEHQTRGADEWHGADGPLWVQDVGKLNVLTEMFLAAGDELQFPRNPDFNGAKQEGFGTYQLTMKGPRRWSGADAFLKPAMERPNVTVIIQAMARRVLLEGGRATGVEIDVGKQKERRVITARKEVILSGGAINSPQLLQLSGIGDPDDLKAAGVTPEVTSPGVGKNLQDHIDVTAMIKTRTARGVGQSLRKAPVMIRDVAQWVLKGTGDFTINPIQGGAFLRSSRAKDVPDLQLVFIPAKTSPHGLETTFGHGATLHVCVLYPKSRGEIRIRSNDPYEHPIIEPNYLAEEEDLEVLTDGYEIARRILAAPAFDEERAEEIHPGPEAMTRSDLSDDVRARAETLYHPTSTCTMGPGEMAVVDNQLRVKGVKGLRVIDASVMPRLVGGNTNAPTYVIAERGSDFILDEAS